MPRLDSSDDEVDELPSLSNGIKSAHSGRIVKPSQALRDPTNAAKVPGQPRHIAIRGGGDTQEENGNGVSKKRQKVTSAGGRAKGQVKGSNAKAKVNPTASG